MKLNRRLRSVRLYVLHGLRVTYLKKSLQALPALSAHMGKIERGQHMPTLALILRISIALNDSAANLMTATESILYTDSEGGSVRFDCGDYLISVFQTCCEAIHRD
ncbi:hypothetical protein XFF6992_460062 [Xanthomonas citri pv. fuscans]|nr:hypothetical protein XFF7767_1000009 [Xanthomonas citri pv. fuscans]SOO12528.1 hypothetical protein XFF7766_1120008 [Xanthomonas citri pv. fuscans]SOO20432.1 hypothetical protein XFF6992_460062 [Xanthomonas citri pv. fuscans]